MQKKKFKIKCVYFYSISNPTPLGQPVNLQVFSENFQNYVKIRNDGLTLEVDPRKKINRFWMQLLIKYKNIFN